MIRLCLSTLATACAMQHTAAPDDGGADSGVEEIEAPRTPCGARSEWAPIASGLDVDLTVVRVVSEDEAWIGGEAGTLFHYVGGSITPVAGPPTSENIGDLWIDPDGGLWVTAWSAAFRRTDAGWERLALEMPDGHVVSTVWGSTSDDVWLGGGMASPQIGFLAHWDGERMTMLDAPAAIQVVHIRGDAADFAVAHLGRVMRRHPARGWENVPGPDGATIGNVWTVAPDEAFFSAGYAQIHHYRDGAWRTYDSGAEQTHYYALWGCSRQDVWAVGWAGSVAHFDGEELEAIVSPRPTDVSLFAIDGHPDGLVLAVGERGTILRLSPAP